MRGGLLLVAVVGFASGILCRSFFIFSWQVLAMLLILSVVSLGAYLGNRRWSYIATVIVLSSFALGSERVMLAPSALPNAYVPLIGTSVSLEGRVLADPDIRETTQRIAIETEHAGVRTKLLVVAPRFPPVGYGDTIRAQGTLALPDRFETDTGRTFAYDRFLAKDGIFALVEKASMEVTGERSGMSAHVMGMLLDAKHAFLDGLSVALPEPGASLAGGLLAGGKQGLGDELLNAFIVAGLVHIVVLSGYNVMIVAEGVLRSLGFLPKRFAALAAGVVIGAFVLMAGAGAASVRAGIMAGLSLLARATGRTYAVIRALLAAAVLMLLLNPLLLAYDPGFQLSFVATLGLILGAPLIASCMGFVRSAFWRDLLAATLAAQISVLPLLLYQTGLLSLVSLPANLIVLPFVPLAMALSAVAGVAGVLLPSVAPWIGLPAHLLLSAIIGVASASASLPLASVTLPSFPFGAVVIAYALLGALVWHLERRRVSPDGDTLRISVH